MNRETRASSSTRVVIVSEYNYNSSWISWIHLKAKYKLKEWSIYLDIEQHVPDGLTRSQGQGHKKVKVNDILKRLMEGICIPDMKAVSWRNQKSYTGFLYNTNLFSRNTSCTWYSKSCWFFFNERQKCIISKRKIIVDQRQYYDRKGLGKNCENVVGFRNFVYPE